MTDLQREDVKKSIKRAIQRGYHAERAVIERDYTGLPSHNWIELSFTWNGSGEQRNDSSGSRKSHPERRTARYKVSAEHKVEQ
jgi:hypothetical protein